MNIRARNSFFKYQIESGSDFVCFLNKMEAGIETSLKGVWKQLHLECNSEMCPSVGSSVRPYIGYIGVEFRRNGLNLNNVSLI